MIYNLRCVTSSVVRCKYVHGQCAYVCVRLTTRVNCVRVAIFTHLFSADLFNMSLFALYDAKPFESESHILIFIALYQILENKVLISHDIFISNVLYIICV